MSMLKFFCRLVQIMLIIAFALNVWSGSLSVQHEMGRGVSILTYAYLVGSFWHLGIALIIELMLRIAQDDR
ncbi:MAG: hypothetical protein K2Q06_06655 [Parvularculaceae bacterium]|nr:hypothetical protein [Parvularculaceae bacterium]